jgi:hypothetical protein
VLNMLSGFMLAAKSKVAVGSKEKEDHQMRQFLLDV